MGNHQHIAPYARARECAKKLIVRAVEAARGESAPPPELELSWLCGENHLPEAGAMYEQDYGLISRMRTLDNIYRTVARVKEMKGNQIHNLTGGERRILKSLLDKGIMI